MDINEFRQWFEAKRTEAKVRMAYHFREAQRALALGRKCLALRELYWTREIRQDWKFYDVTLP